MRAVVCRNWCDPSGLSVEEVPAPSLPRGGVRIDVHAAGLNFADMLIIAGKYQTKPPLPFLQVSRWRGALPNVAQV